MMMGDTTGGFIGGAEAWLSPSTALSAAGNAITNYSTAFTGSNLAYTIGILAVPAFVLFLVLGRKHR